MVGGYGLIELGLQKFYSLMHDMTTDFLETHVTQREYLEGMLYFKKRFDLEGAVVEDISPKHLKSAQNRLAKLTGTEVS